MSARVDEFRALAERTREKGHPEAAADIDARADQVEGIEPIPSTDPRVCPCYSTTDNDGVIHPVLCQAHRDEFHQALGGFHWVLPKYQRYFATEQDAIDRQRIIYGRWPTEGYGTTVRVIPISRWWLLRANWSDSCD